MGGIRSGKIWTRQPQVPVVLNRANPLTDAITTCIPFNGNLWDIVTGNSVTLGSGGELALSDTGVALVGSGTTARASIPIALSGYSKLSLSFLLDWDAFAGDNALAMEYGTNQQNDGFIINPNDPSGNFSVAVASTGTFKSTEVARPSVALSHHYAILFDRTGGVGVSGASIYINGQLKTRVGGLTNDINDTFADNTLYIFSRAGSSLYGSGKLQNLIFRAGYLSTAEEIRKEYENPWQIFARKKRNMWSGSATGGADLAGDATATATSTAALAVSIQLAAAGISTATATGGLSLSLPLAGAATATASATGGLSLSVPLSAAAAANAAATGDIAINLTLSGDALAEAASVAGLDVQSAGAVDLAGDALAESSATGALSLAIPLSGASLVVASASGSLTQIVPLASAAAAVSQATGGLDVSVALSGAALAEALASAGLSVTSDGLGGAASSEASAAATLTLRVNLDGAALANAVATGALAGTGALTGTTGYLITGSSRTWRIAS